MVRGTPPVVPCSTFLFKFGRFLFEEGDASASFVRKAAKRRMLLGSCGMHSFPGIRVQDTDFRKRSPVEVGSSAPSKRWSALGFLNHEHLGGLRNG